jgi:uncharacterized membrane protein YvlD (DUF360 family)
LEGAAVKVTVVPVQMLLLGLAEIVNPGVKLVLTTMITSLEVSGLAVAHPALEVIIQVILSPSASVLFE